MPKAVASQETYRFDLKTLPGAYVVLRKFTYGEVIARREMAQALSAPMGDGSKMDFALNLRAVALYEFAHAIVEHNLEDESGNPLNMQNAADVSRLDPQVAQEIEELIDGLNKPMTDSERLPLSVMSGVPSQPKAALE